MEGTEVATGLGGLLDQAKDGLPKILDMGTSIFNWLIENPLFLLGIIFFIVIAVTGIVKRAR